MSHNTEVDTSIHKEIHNNKSTTVNMKTLKVERQLKLYEQKVVASILHNKQVGQYVIDNNLDYRFFPTYEKIMKIFSSLANGTVEPTVELLITQLNLSTESENETLLSMLEGLKEEVVELEEVKVYLQMLKKQYKIRRYYDFATDLQHMIEKEKINPLDSEFDELDKEIDFRFSQLLEEYSKTDRIDMSVSQGYEHVLKNVEESLHTENRQVIPTGYEEVDNVYNGGNLKGTYSIVAGRPAMGKTVYMLNECIESSKSGANNIFISIEMNQIQCFQRIIAKIAGIDSGKLQQPRNMTSSDWTKLRKAATDIVELLDGKLWIVEVTELNNQRMRRIIQEYKKKHDIDSVYVDYVQIMSTDKGNKPELESDYANISEGIRKTAKAENVSIIVGSQLSRSIESREDKRPKMSDLRNSGAFEQDAARVVGLYRDEYYNPETTEEPGILEYIILKNRFGASNTTVKFKYNIHQQDIFPNVA
ncbi:DnaB-like helicase C-terminal domain-containing protein [Priestia filamentosa]|uniref:DnaB-like helicase C-terminal domain-containing protein n=1 Tax=Priestia filamentosa TaxID=1402861 RepID=UPI00397E557C